MNIFSTLLIFCFHSRCMRSNDAVSHDMRCGFLETRTVVGTPFVCTNCATLVQYHHLSNRITWQFLTLHAHGSQPLRWAQYIGHCVIFVYGFMCNKIQCHLSERRNGCHIRLCGQIWEHYARQCSLELAHNMCLNFILSIKMHAADGNYCVDVRTIWAGKQSQEDTCSHVSRSSDTLIIVIEMIMVNFLLARVHWKWNAKLWCFAVVYPIN